jgi:hypothetical protein
MKLNWTDAPGLIGLALIVSGVAHFSGALALITLGSAGVFYSYRVGK